MVLSFRELPKCVICHLSNHDKDGKLNDMTKELIFKDLFQHSPCSLAQLFSNLEPDSKRHIKTIRNNYPIAKDAAVMEKGPLQLCSLDSFERLHEMCLPSQEFFYNKLN